MKKYLLFWLLGFGSLLQTGCHGTFESIGSGVVDGVKKDGRIDTLTYDAMKGLVLGLTDSASKAKIDSLIRSVGYTLKQSTDSILLNVGNTVVSIRDSVIGDYLLAHVKDLQEALTGQKLRENIAKLVDTVLGDPTRKKVKRLVATVIDEALSNANRDKLNRLLDTLGGTATEKIKILIDTAIAHINVGTNRLQTQANTEISFLQKHATQLLVTAAAIIVASIGLIVYFFRKKNQYAKVSDVLTYQIYNTKNDIVRNDLKTRISEHAKQDSVEPLLREILNKKGILGVDPPKTLPTQ